MLDGQPAPGSVRPIHRADVHIIKPAGSELWLDVKIHTVATDLATAKELLRKEHTKCRTYGQRDGFQLQALEKGMTPVVSNNMAGLPPGHKPLSTGLSTIACSSLLDKDFPSRTPKGLSTPSCGAPSHAPCSEQLGRHTQNAHRKWARPILVRLHPACLIAPGGCLAVACLSASTFDSQNTTESGVKGKTRLKFGRPLLGVLF